MKLEDIPKDKQEIMLKLEVEGLIKYYKDGYEFTKKGIKIMKEMKKKGMI